MLKNGRHSISLAHRTQASSNEERIYQGSREASFDLGLGFVRIGTDEFRVFVGLVNHVVFLFHRGHLVDKPGIACEVESDLCVGRTDQGRDVPLNNKTNTIPTLFLKALKPPQSVPSPFRAVSKVTNRLHLVY